MLEGIRRYDYFNGTHVPDERGQWVTVADVADAWSAKLAEIRAAVGAERSAVDGPYWARTAADDAEWVRVARAALDALLAVAPEAEVTPVSTYRVEWPCCNSVTETDCWEPQRCPFCEPDIPDGGVVRVLKTIGPLPPPSPDIIPPLEAALPGDAPAASDDAAQALARFGAYVVRDWFRRTSGFQAADGFQLDEGALGTGVVTRGATVGYRHAPGIRDAVARLLKEESHA